ncbi:MAG: XRE family transcriptional regulator, partial [Clostridiales bacterium]
RYGGGNMLSERLKILRKQNNLTQIALAAKLNLDKSSIAKYESANVTPSPDILLKMASIFGVSVDYLLGRNNYEDDYPQQIQPTTGVWIPVLGKVQAGIPIEAIEEILDYEEISKSMAEQGDYFALQIKGNSMEPQIYENDVAIVRQQNDCDSNDIAVVLINGDEATVKRIKKRPEGLMLIPNNPIYEPMFYNNEQIAHLPVILIGKVVEIRRKL